MANKASSCLFGFFLVGVSCAVPGLLPGGEGRDVSAALALSSRNLSNSGWRRTVRRKQQNACRRREDAIPLVLPSLVTPSSASSPFCGENSRNASNLEDGP